MVRRGASSFTQSPSLFTQPQNRYPPFGYPTGLVGQTYLGLSSFYYGTSMSSPSQETEFPILGTSAWLKPSLDLENELLLPSVSAKEKPVLPSVIVKEEPVDKDVAVHSRRSRVRRSQKELEFEAYEITGREFEKLKQTSLSNLFSHLFTFFLATAISTGLALDQVATTFKHPLFWTSLCMTSAVLTIVFGFCWHITGDKRSKVLEEIEDSLRVVEEVEAEAEDFEEDGDDSE